MKTLINKVLQMEDLREEEMIRIMEKIMEGQLTDAQVACFLTALKIKGESLEEILGASKVLRNKADKVKIENKYIVDNCGTGGDGKSTFNISTTASFVAASYIPVIKHGNRSVSSKCGSADLLEILGINLSQSQEQINQLLEETNLAFLYAPNYHKTMKNVGKIRKELETRTIFNILGPLINPSQPKAQLIGVYHEDLTSKFTHVLRDLGVERAMVVHGLDGLDEITVTGKSRISELKGGKIEDYYLDPKDYGISYARPEDLRGGSKEENAQILINILKGEKGAKRDIVLLNAGAAIYVGAGADSLGEGIKLAEKSIDSGQALENFQTLRTLAGEERNDSRRNII